MPQLERIPIQPGKPDLTIFKYTKEVASHGFPEQGEDWLAKEYLTDGEKREAFRKHGKREETAIISVLISGLDRIVVNEIANRPHDGLVENINKFDPNLPPKYQPIDIFNSDYELEYINEIDGEEIKLDGPDGFFVLLAESMANTFNMAFDMHLDALVELAEKNPQGEMSSIFARLSDLEKFEKKFQKGKSFRTFIKENIQSGSEEMAIILKMIMTLSPPISPAEIVEIAKNSYVLLAELAMMEGRVSRNRVLGQIISSSLYDPTPNHLGYFTMVTNNKKSRLDVSDSFKSLVRDIDRFEPDSGISERLTCPAIKVVNGEPSPVIKGMWNIYVSFAERIYARFYCQKTRD